MRINKIILYPDDSTPEINKNQLFSFIKEKLKIKVELRDDFVETNSEKFTKVFSELRVHDLKKKFIYNSHQESDYEFEKKFNDYTKQKQNEIFYEGFKMQKNFSSFLPDDENTLSVLSIIITNKLIGTFDENDYRFHARAILLGNPTIISTSGIIEGPAKPKKFYLDMMTNFSQISESEIEKKYQGEFLTYHDLRLPQILEGYIMQAISFIETGEEFCENDFCRIFNSHWQRDLIDLNVIESKLCPKHKKLFFNLD